MTVDASALLRMSRAELDDLFRASPAGDIPRGEAAGTVIVFPDSPLADVAARVARLVVWKGKVFDPDKGELHNKVSPLGVLGVRAQVFKGPSWFDGEECIVIDYSRTSVVAQWVRDELRQVAPGVYLGIAYWEKQRLLNFALEF